MPNAGNYLWGAIFGGKFVLRSDSCPALLAYHGEESWGVSLIPSACIIFLEHQFQ
jgi:hypothetical protein